MIRDSAAFEFKIYTDDSREQTIAVLEPDVVLKAEDLTEGAITTRSFTAEPTTVQAPAKYTVEFSTTNAISWNGRIDIRLPDDLEISGDGSSTVYSD